MMNNRAVTWGRPLIPWLVISTFGVWACAGNGGGPNGGQDGGVANADTGLPDARDFATWETLSVDDGPNSGWQPAIARALGGTVGIAYYKRLASAGTCVRNAIQAPVSRWEIWYAASTGGAFTTERVTGVRIEGLAGLSLAYDPQGRPVIAYQGGAESAAGCGGSDVMIASKSGSLWSTNVIVASGATPLAFPAEDQSACVQDICNRGDDVGEWPAVGFVGNERVIAYRDTHFGIAQDDEEKADLEVSVAGQSRTLDTASGAGVCSRMVVDGGARLFILSLNEYETLQREGLWVYKLENSVWSRQQISPERRVGTCMGFSGFGQKLAAAYHAIDEKKLKYLESIDGVTWSTEVTVDLAGNTGYTPSLAFLPDGRPIIAYHYCGPYRPNSSDCLPTTDALRLAVRDGEQWSYGDVVATSGGTDGADTAITTDASGRVVIAYQALFHDAQTGEVTRKLQVARGTLR